QHQCRSQTFSLKHLCRGLLRYEPLREIALASLQRSFLGWPPAASTGRTNLEAISWPNLDSNLLCAQHARRPACREQPIVMRFAVLAAQQPAGTVPRTVAGRIAKCWLVDFEHQIERYSEAAAKLTVTARVRAEFMVAKQQRKAGLG